MDYAKLGQAQAIALIVIVMLNHLILNLPKNMFLLTGNSILLNIGFLIIIMFLFVFLIIKLFSHFRGHDILDVSQYLGGNVLKTIIGILYLIFFVVVAGTLLRNFVEGIKQIYFQQVPVYLLLVIFLAIAVIANRFGVNSVAKYNSVITILMMVNLLLVLLSPLSNYVPQKLFPILGYGVNETFFSGMSNLYCFSGFCFLYFIIPLLKDNKNFSKVSYIGIGISSIYLFLAMITLLFSFSSVVSIYELSPIYLVLRSTDFGRFFQRPDAVFILFWMLAMMSYLSVIIMFCCISFKKITKVKENKILSLLFAMLIFIVAIFPQNLAQVRDMETIFYRYATIILAFVITPIILVLANIKYKRSHIQSSIGEAKQNE